MRDALPRMAKRKTKRNAGRLQERQCFKIRQDPTVHLAEEGPLADAGHGSGPTRAHGSASLFAIARDGRTIFASWNIDWRSVFENAIPADQKVYLRVSSTVGVLIMTVAVEPMSTTQYLTISSLHDSYRLEMGYFQPLETWHSIAMSPAIEMPRQESVGLDDVDLATIPFHLSFQKLAKLFRVPNNTSMAKVMSEFQKRVSNNQKPNDLIRSETKILRNLNLSLSEIASAERDFKKTGTDRLTRRARVMLSMSRDQSAARIRGESSWS
jgi:Domain of unknown function (DUF4912)